MQTTWSPEQKAEALRLVAASGVAEAARQVGIPFGTVASWASRAGVRAPDTGERSKATAAAALTMTERRQRLADGLMSDVEHIRSQLLGGAAIDQQRRATAIATLVGVNQLLTGEATSRVESTVGRAQLIEEARERANHLRVA